MSVGLLNSASVIYNIMSVTYNRYGATQGGGATFLATLESHGRQNCRNKECRIGLKVRASREVFTYVHIVFWKQRFDSIDIEQRKISLDISVDVLHERLSKFERPVPKYTTGVMAKYVALVGSAADGAVTSQPAL
jgi:hypothetical protein